MCGVSVILKRSGHSYQDIVHIYDDFDSFLCPFVFQGAEDVVHHILECDWGVAQAKVHDHGFIEAMLCFECCFV